MKVLQSGIRDEAMKKTLSKKETSLLSDFAELLDKYGVVISWWGDSSGLSEATRYSIVGFDCHLEPSDVVAWITQREHSK